MTLIAPLWMVLAGVAALGAVALHLITTRRPPPALLPTARFVPHTETMSAARAARPSDLWLLAVRVLALLALGAAFGGLAFAPGGAIVRRVFVADRSRAATSAVRDSTLARWREGDALVLVDSMARAVGAGAGDSLRAFSTVGARGVLSAGIAAARRAAGAVASPADSVELVIVSPFAADEFDAATATLAAAWPGRLRVIRSVIAEPPPQRVELRASASAADTALARSGVAIVVWPSMVRVPVPSGAITRGALAATRPNGVATFDAVLVAPLAVEPLPDGGLVVARWASGGPAAVERVAGDGCLRTVGVGVPAAGDVPLQAAFREVARTLLGSCAARAVSPSAPDSLVRALERRGAAASVIQLRDRDAVPPLTPWLLVAALLLLVGELALRGAVVARAP